jgi:hypothetical protein
MNWRIQAETEIDVIKLCRDCPGVDLSFLDLSTFRCKRKSTDVLWSPTTFLFRFTCSEMGPMRLTGLDAHHVITTSAVCPRNLSA